MKTATPEILPMPQSRDQGDVHVSVQSVCLNVCHNIHIFFFILLLLQGVTVGTESIPPP